MIALELLKSNRMYTDSFLKLKNGDHPKSSIALGYDNRRELLQIITADSFVSTELYANKEIVVFGMFTDVNLGHGQRMMTPPYFMLLTDEMIPEGALHDLKGIRF